MIPASPSPTLDLTVDIRPTGIVGMALAALTRARHIFAQSGRKIELFYDVISPYSYVGFEVRKISSGELY
jgi:hypothetical protein